MREVIHVLRARQQTRGVYERRGHVPGRFCRSRMGLMAIVIGGACARSAEGLTLDLLAGDEEAKEDEALRMCRSDQTM